MKKALYIRKLIMSIVSFVLLLYFMNQNSGQKLIFIPFIFCSISMIGKYISLLLAKNKFVMIFDKLFKVGFLLFWFGFLLFTMFIILRDQNYGMLIILIPFWFCGLFILKNKFLNKASKKTKHSNPCNLKIIISFVLVCIALMAGIYMFITGIIDSNIPLIFAGTFFILVSGVFIIAGLTVLGYFDHTNIDVLGLYAGTTILVIGIEIPWIKYIESKSITNTISEFGIWIIIPVLLIVFGMIQIVKTLKNNKK